MNLRGRSVPNIENIEAMMWEDSSLHIFELKTFLEALMFRQKELEHLRYTVSVVTAQTCI
jgi:hypothetical protein